MHNPSPTASKFPTKPGKVLAWCAAAAAAFCVLAASSASAAPTLINGSMTGPIANGDVPSGWSNILTSDTVDQNNNDYGVPGMVFPVPASASPDGGTWVGLAMYPGYAEGFFQTVSGFTVGSRYTLSWYHANFAYPAPDSQGNAIEVLADGVSIGSGAFLDGGAGGWVEESITFVAANTSLELTFTSLLTFSDAASYQAIDGIRLTEAPAANAVPEPASLSLFAGAGLALLLAGRRRKLANQASDTPVAPVAS